MDCSRRLADCKASRVNSAKRAAKFDSRGTIELAKNNSRIVVDTHNRIISLEAITNIPRYQEIFCDYGKHFLI